MCNNINQTTCCICGNIVDSDKTIMMMCEDCVSKCTDCGKQSTDLIYTEVYDNDVHNYHRKTKLLCDDCMKTYVTCSTCLVKINPKDADFVDGKYRCKKCNRIKCRDCHNMFTYSDAHLIYTEYDRYERYVCTECLKNYNECDICKCKLQNGTGEFINGKHYCNHCAYENFLYCSKCKSYYKKKDVAMHTVFLEDSSVERWCENCTKEHAHYCSECKCYYENNITHYVNQYNEYWCDNCLRRYSYMYNAPENTEIYPICVLDYHEHKGMDLNFHCLPEDNTYKYFGIELETCEGVNYLIDVEKLLSFDKDFYYEYDGSIGNNPRECISHPRTINSWNKFYRSGRLNEFCDVLSNAKFISEDWKKKSGCGLHVHISKDAFENWETDVIKIVGVMSIIWDKVIVKIANRGDCYFSSHISNFNFKANKRYVKNIIEITNDHCCAINTENDDTIELRFNRGTLVAEDLIAKMQFIDYLTEYAKKFSIAELFEIEENDEEFIREFLNGIKEPELLAYCHKVGLN